MQNAFINTSECLIVDIENMAMHRDSLYQIVKFWGKGISIRVLELLQVTRVRRILSFLHVKTISFLLYPPRGRSGGENNTTKCQPVYG